MIDEKKVREIAFEECNEWVCATSFDFSEARLLKFAKRLLEAHPRVPVAWQTRVDLTSPYSCIQGWQEWKFCTKEEYESTLYWIDRGYIVYQARELFL